MKQLMNVYRDGNLKVEEVPVPHLNDGCILVQNEYSIISLGTESKSIELAKMNLLEKALSRPKDLKMAFDLAKKEGFVSTYQKSMNILNQPISLGYSSAGIVIEVADDVFEYKVGDRVACGGSGHAEVVCVPKNLCTKIPDGVKSEEAAFTTIGSIALQGVRQSDPKLGEVILVIGLGLVGQLVVQILKTAGCKVIGVDNDEMKVKISEDGGADLALPRNVDDLKQKIFSYTGGYGVDAVIIAAATQSNDPIELASDTLRDKGRITVVGAVRTDLPRKPFYEKELSLNFSRSYGPGRYDKVYEEKGIDYPIGYVRWTEKRNMGAFLDLVDDGKINLDLLITHKFKFEDATQAYNIITQSKDLILGVVFEYPKKINLGSKIEVRTVPYPPCKEGTINVGFIGAGKFAQNYLLPLISEMSFVRLIGLATATGINAHYIGKKFRFGYITTNADEIIADDTIDCVIIATRHNLHAKYAIEGLRANKHVYVEKPLALTEIELEGLVKEWENTNRVLMVGLNRRFSSLVRTCKKELQRGYGPTIINYQVNAGKYPLDHWVYDPVIGGGRIVGECVHFFDVMNYIVGSKVRGISALSIDTTDRSVKSEDNIVVTVKYEDGSIGNLIYRSIGNPDYPKEMIQINRSEITIDLHDYQTLAIYGKRCYNHKLRKRDKGHKEEIRCFFEAIRNGSTCIPMEEIIEVHQIAYKVEKEIKGFPNEYP